MALSLDQKIVAIDRVLAEAGIPHAFGGAVALAYHATPRGTIDIDVNVFVPAAKTRVVLGALAPLGVETRDPRVGQEIRERGQARVRWDRTPVDLFFAYDPLHDQSQERAQVVQFGEDASIPILSAEDLAIFKVLFDRRKDRADVSEILYAQGARFDAVYALSWLRRILDPADERLRRFEERVRAPR